MKPAWIATAFFALLLTLRFPASAQAPRLSEDDLYKAETIVTGTGETERLRGFGVGAEEAIIKLTGDGELAEATASSRSSTTPRRWLPTSPMRTE